MLKNVFNALNGGDEANSSGSSSTTYRSIAMPTDFQDFSRIITCMVGDGSGSMEGPSFDPPKTRLQMLIEANQIFLNASLESRPQDYLAVVFYSSNANIICPFLNVREDYQALSAAFVQMQFLPHQGTNMNSGLQAASALFRQFARQYESLSRNDNERILLRIIAYTDGHSEATKEGESTAQLLKKSGILIETFGIAPTPADVNESFLKKVATKDEQGYHYRFLQDSRTLRTIFKKAAEGKLVFKKG